MRVSLQPAFILHHRPYRESSLLLDVFSQDHGRVALIARGVRKEKSSLRPLLQPFSPLLISWQGRSELMTLSTAEPSSAPFLLKGDCLLSGFYLNELLVKLLQKQDPHPRLYTIYEHTLLELTKGLTADSGLQKQLRLFEKKLLEELGYGLRLHDAIPDGKALIADQLYQFYPELGFKLCEPHEIISESRVFRGSSILSLAAEQLEDELSLRDAKRLMRIVLTGLLGNQPLQSRKLFTTVSVEQNK